MYDKGKAQDMLERKMFLEGWCDIRWRMPKGKVEDLQKK